MVKRDRNNDFRLNNAPKTLCGRANPGHLRELIGNVPQCQLGIERVQACTR